jgi:hypothetical protein
MTFWNIDLYGVEISSVRINPNVVNMFDICEDSEDISKDDCATSDFLAENEIDTYLYEHHLSWCTNGEDKIYLGFYWIFPWQIEESMPKTEEEANIELIKVLNNLFNPEDVLNLTIGVQTEKIKYI